MKKALLLIFILGIFIRCTTEAIRLKECATPATLKDLSGLDGCGWVFELNDGTILNPQMIFRCGTPPLPQEVTEDPLFNFQWTDGKRVLISYEYMEGSNICMAGKLAKITCVQEADPVPDCVLEKIEELKNEPVWNPPAVVYQYNYHGKKVYFVPQHCCDFFSILYDENCNVLCAPDGGIAGGGDGQCPDFFSTRTDEEIVWSDERVK